jgi:hypothetical protein
LTGTNVAYGSSSGDIGYDDDIISLEHELRKARERNNNVNVRTANVNRSNEDIQRDSAVRMRIARVQELANENYSIDDIAFITGQPKYKVETDMWRIRKARHEREKHNEYVSEMLYGSSASDGFRSLMEG